MQPPRNNTLLIVAGFVIVIMVGLNILIGQIANPPAPGAETQPEAAGDAPAAQTTPPANGSGGPRLVEMPAEATLGAPTAKNEVVLGWSWTPEVQADPGALEQTIAALGTAARGAKVRVVNTDVVPGVQRGLVVNGKLALPLPPDGIIKPEAAREAVTYLLTALPPPAQTTR